MKYVCNACNGDKELNGHECGKCNSTGELESVFGNVRLLNNQEYEDNGTNIDSIVTRHIRAMYKELDALDKDINKRDIFYFVMTEAHSAHLDSMLGL